MNYSGKICDGCREPLENGDDIVVCPVCGTPQHRSCYEKNHKCVNEYLHSTGFVWTDPDEGKKKSEPVSVQNETTQPAQDQPEKQPSFVQATPQNMESVFMRGVLYDPKDDMGKVRVSEAADFIQNSSPRYIHKYMKQKRVDGSSPGTGRHSSSPHFGSSTESCIRRAQFFLRYPLSYLLSISPGNSGLLSKRLR